MSITQQDLDKVKRSLRKGDFTRVAKTIKTSQPWVSKVLADLNLAQQNPNVISAALDVIEERNDSNNALRQRIEELTK